MLSFLQMVIDDNEQNQCADVQLIQFEERIDRIK